MRFSEFPAYDSTYRKNYSSQFYTTFHGICYSHAGQRSIYASPRFVILCLCLHRSAKYYAVFPENRFLMPVWRLTLADSDRHVPCSALCHHVGASFVSVTFGQARKLLPFAAPPSSTESSILREPVSCARSFPEVFAVCVSSERSFSCTFSIAEKKNEIGIAKRWDFALFYEDFRAFGNLCYTHENDVFDAIGEILKWM